MFAHHLEVGPFPSDFIFSYVLVPFLRADEELGRFGEVVDFLKSNIVKFKCVVVQVQDDGDYPLGIDDPPNAIDFYMIPFF